VDYDTGTNNDECGELTPCDTIENAFNSPLFYLVVEDVTPQDIVIKVQGTLTGSTDSLSISDIGVTPTATSITVQPWNSTPILDESGFSLETDNTTLEGFEIKNRYISGGSGIVVSGSNAVIRNNYIHDKATGIIVWNGANNASIYNNVLAGNWQLVVTGGGFVSFFI